MFKKENDNILKFEAEAGSNAYLNIKYLHKLLINLYEDISNGRLYYKETYVELLFNDYRIQFNKDRKVDDFEDSDLYKTNCSDIYTIK